MVQKKPKRPQGARQPLGDSSKKRGRPRAFEPEHALQKAMDTFRDGGFAATSLEDLSEAMGINRPSLYGTFGDKRDLFIKTYERYLAEMQACFAPAFAPGQTLRQTLEAMYAIALDIYLAGENGPRGCFTVMTATSEIMADSQIRPLVQSALTSAQRVVSSRLQRAKEEGELPPESDLQMLAQLAASTFDTLAIRARARMPRAELETIARRTVDMICGRGDRRSGG